MGIVTAITAAGAAISAIGGAVGANQAKKAAGRAQRNKINAERELENIKAGRATIINPYSGTKNLSNMASDLSGQMNNPFGNLGVATSAAEIQMGQRVQAADAAGKSFEFEKKEARTNMDMNRAAGQISQAQQQEADANAARASAIGGAISGVVGIAGAYVGGMAGKPGKPKTGSGGLGGTYKDYKASGGTQGRKFFRSIK